MAKKLGLARVLGAGSLASVAYGEIGSSIYFALGVVALYALGATPWVLLGVGALFLLVALSYAEGTSALPETGGAATFVRRAFNDPAGFITGWALFLDYLIVIALAGLFVPHYLGTALGWDAVTDSPWDVVFGVVAILGVAGIRLVRRARMYTAAIFIAVLAFLSHLLLIGLGFAFLLSREGFGEGIDLGTAPTWHALVFSLSLAMLAFTGLETVANLAAEVREPGKALPRSLFAGIGAVVIVSFAIAAIGLSAYPPHPDPAGPDGVGDRPGHDLDPRPARRDLRGVRRLAARRCGRHDQGLHRRHGRDHPRLGDRHVALGGGPARLLARAASDAAAVVRPPEPEDVHRAGLDRERRGHRRGAPRDRRLRRRARSRSSRASTASACSSPSPPPSSPSSAFASSEPDLARPYRVPVNIRVRGVVGAARAADRRPAHVRALDRGALHARRGEDRGPDLARPRRHPLRRGAEGAPERLLEPWSPRSPTWCPRRRGSMSASSCPSSSA